MMRLAIVTNIPAPYRVPIYNLIAARSDIELAVYYAVEREPDRSWDLPPLNHTHTFLRGRMYTRGGRFIHDNPATYDKLKAFQPDVVLTTGFNPTHLYAFAWAWLNGRKHVAMTDGTDISEANLSRLHRTVRRFVFARSQSFVAASDGARRLYRSYGIADERIHTSPLCANTAVDWSAAACGAGAAGAASVDLLFSGRLVAVKNPSFVIEVARLVAASLGRRVRVAMLGAGPLEAQLRTEAAAVANQVEVTLVGHVNQSDVPSWFARAKLFLFPTSWDPWGVVANEACLAGVPVIVSPHAGVAGELVRDGVNGRVLPLDVHTWAAAAVELLASDDLWKTMSDAARLAVAPYNFERAAQGIIDAALQAAAPRVVCVQRRLTHYRVPLFERVRTLLAARGVRFDLVYGDPTAEERKKRDEGVLAWGMHVPCRYWLNDSLCWQNSGPMARGANLLIVTQENKLLYNLLALTLRRPRLLAFWGHGCNFQTAAEQGWLERFKRRVSVRADWWFAYTGLSKRVVQDLGFPNSRITNLENAVDTEAFADQCDCVSAADIRRFRARHALGEGPLGIYVGSLYAEKRIEFLLAAGARLSKSVAGFRLLVVGDGPQRALVEATAKAASWLRYVGVQYGADKAVCMRAAAVVLNPGMVGLGILDAFAAGVPMLTTDCKLHSPEIDYLRSGENGLMTADSVEAYVAACERLLADPGTREALGRQARLDAAHYSVDNMAEHFCEGVLSALKLKRR